MSQPVEPEIVSNNEPKSASRFEWLNWSALFLAFLQSVCTAFVAFHGVRLLVGIGAVILASSAWRIAERLHADAIRIPMIVIAVIGSLLNLLALWQVRRLRARPSAAWRQKQLTPAKRRSESLQLVLSVLTLVLVLGEEIAHYHLKGAF